MKSVPGERMEPRYQCSSQQQLAPLSFVFCMVFVFTSSFCPMQRAGPRTDGSNSDERAGGALLALPATSHAV